MRMTSSCARVQFFLWVRLAFHAIIVHVEGMDTKLLARVVLGAAPLIGFSSLSAGDIVYVNLASQGRSLWQNPGDAPAVDLNGDGIIEFGLPAVRGDSEYYGIEPSAAVAVGWDGVSQLLPHGALGLAADVQPGTSIGFATTWASFDLAFLSRPSVSEPISSNWPEIQGGHIGYAAVRFLAGDGSHFGWLEIASTPTRDSMSILAYAYETSPTVSIEAGAVPGPGTIGVLICGLGVIATRRRT